MRPSLHFAKKRFLNKPAIGVEVGVCEGHNAQTILLEWEEVQKLYLVEIEKTYEQLIKDNLKDFEGKYELFFGDSMEMSGRFTDYSIDFVYIDDDHEYDGVARSLNSWYPKLKVGGVFSGHDFHDIAVEDAVRGFFARNKIDLQLDENDWWGVKL